MDIVLGLLSGALGLGFFSVCICYCLRLNWIGIRVQNSPRNEMSRIWWCSKLECFVWSDFRSFSPIRLHHNPLGYCDVTFYSIVAQYEQDITISGLCGWWCISINRLSLSIIRGINESLLFDGILILLIGIRLTDWICLQINILQGLDRIGTELMIQFQYSVMH